MHNMNNARKLYPAGHIFSGNYQHSTFLLANLEGTLMLRGNFYRCSFVTARFRDAVISESVFVGCNFDNAFLGGAKLRHSEFSDCSFRAADFANAKGLTSCTFRANCRGLDSIRGARAALNHKIRAYFVSPLYNTEPKPKALPPATPTAPTITVDDLVDPEPLPAVAHYRSPPSKVARGKLESARKWGYLDDGDDDDYYYSSASSAYKKHLWGYGTCAVLECSDIDEYREAMNGR